MTNGRKLFGKFPNLLMAVFQIILVVSIILHFTSNGRILQLLANSRQVNRKNQQNCPPEWPELELFLPLAPTNISLNEAVQLLFPSLALFWPQHLLSLLVVTDADKTKIFENFSKNLARTVYKMFPRLRKFAIKPNTLPYVMKGHDRQQWLMMWADNFTNAEYVGFVDSDAVFVTRVTSYDLFNGHKPIVRGLYGKPHPAGWDAMPHTTYKLLGRKEPFSCMTYFPVVIKTRHLPLMRDLITHLSGARTFDDVFKKGMRGRKDYSQFHIMCAYIWWHQRSSYYFTLGERDHFWNDSIPEGQIANLAEGGLEEDLYLRQQPHLAIHWPYETFITERDALKNCLRAGVCFSTAAAQQRPRFCSSFPNRTAQVNNYEWYYEGIDIRPWNKSQALKAHRQRLEAIDKCLHEFDDTLIDLLSN